MFAQHLPLLAVGRSFQYPISRKKTCIPSAMLERIPLHLDLMLLEVHLPECSFPRAIRSLRGRWYPVNSLTVAVAPAFWHRNPMSSGALRDWTALLFSAIRCPLRIVRRRARRTRSRSWRQHVVISPKRRSTPTTATDDNRGWSLRATCQQGRSRQRWISPGFLPSLGRHMGHHTWRQITTNDRAGRAQNAHP